MFQTSELQLIIFSQYTAINATKVITTTTTQYLVIMIRYDIELNIIIISSVTIVIKKIVCVMMKNKYILSFSFHATPSTAAP